MFMYPLTADEALKLDLAELRKEGFLNDGKKTPIFWKNGDKTIGSANIEVLLSGDDPAVKLFYKTEADQEDHEVVVYLRSTACRFGGERWWFHCPNEGCRKRVRILYNFGDKFICRKCTCLKYESQRYCSPWLKLYCDLAKAKKMEKGMKRRYYDGSPTRKYRQLLKLVGKMDEAERSGVLNKIGNTVLT